MAILDVFDSKSVPKSLKQHKFDGKHFSFEERDTHLYWEGIENPVKISTPDVD